MQGHPVTLVVVSLLGGFYLVGLYAAWMGWVYHQVETTLGAYHPAERAYALGLAVAVEITPCPWATLALEGQKLGMLQWERFWRGATTMHHC